jgi:hypothetical protein
MSSTSHRIEIKVEAPLNDKQPNDHYRRTVFSVNMESSLPLETIQMWVNNLFTALVVEAAPKIQISENKHGLR